MIRLVPLKSYCASDASVVCLNQIILVNHSLKHLFQQWVSATHHSCRKRIRKTELHLLSKSFRCFPDIADNKQFYAIQGRLRLPHTGSRGFSEGTSVYMSMSRGLHPEKYLEPNCLQRWKMPLHKIGAMERVHYEGQLLPPVPI